MREYFTQLFDLQYQLQLATGRGINLLRQMTKLWGILVFFLAVAFRGLSGFAPALYANPQSERTLVILTGFYVAFALTYAGFLLRGDRYEHPQTSSAEEVIETEDDGHGNIVPKYVIGNKSVWTYVLAMLIWIAFFITEWLIGQPKTALLALFGFVQVITVAFPDSLEEQGTHLLPFFANIVLLLTAIYYLAIG